MKQLKQTVKESIFDIDDESLTNKQVLTIAKGRNHLEKLMNDYVEKLKSEDTFDGIVDFNWIDVSHVDNLSEIFYDADVEHYNFDVSEWDVSNASNVSGMFKNCREFDGDVSKFKFKNIINFEEMFLNCKKFKGKGLHNWDVSTGVWFNNMFSHCESLDLNEVKHWNMKNALHIRNMFNCLGKDKRGDATDVIQWNLKRALAYTLNEFVKDK